MRHGHFQINLVALCNGRNLIRVTKMNEWISVEDRLPKNNEQVLIWYKFDPSNGTWDYRSGMMMTSFSYGGNVVEYPEDKPGYWLTHWDQKISNWHVDDRYQVTHWMSLPPQPEQLI